MVAFPHIRQSLRAVNPVVNWGFVKHRPVAFGWQDLATSYQGLPGIIGNRYQDGDGTTSVCDLDGLPVRDPCEVATGVLAKLSYPDSFCGHMYEPLGRLKVWSPSDL
jgi:hypothetical protein